MLPNQNEEKTKDEVTKICNEPGICQKYNLLQINLMLIYVVHYAHECTNTIAAVAFYIPRRMSRTLAKTNFAPKKEKKREIVLQREKTRSRKPK